MKTKIDPKSGREYVICQYAEERFGAQVGEVRLFVHAASVCEGQERCSIHKPSDHPLKDAPFNWRSDRGIMERICEHGIGHDDADDVWYRINVRGENPKYADVHGCDGCCRG